MAWPDTITLMTKVVNFVTLRRVTLEYPVSLNILAVTFDSPVAKLVLLA
jgi:hypothetical protein